MKLLLGIVATALSVPVAAQLPGSADPRIQTVEFRPDQIVRIDAAPGYQVTVELAPDEQIKTVAVGDSTAWSVSAPKAGDRLFVKPVQAGASTNMIVVTSARTYNFDLSVGGGNATYTLRFHYPNDTPRILTSGQAAGFYRFSGSDRLWPDAMHDDGERTFIAWLPDDPLPAVYIVDSLGREQLANGNMRGNIYVIDSVVQRLVFRIDRNIARANRFQPKPPKK